ncbi:hypothetical protein Tco_0674267 [Tanacetum coccineum]
MEAVEVPQTLEYMGGQLNATPMTKNSVINCLTAKSTWDDLILYHEGPSDVKESRVMDLKLCYNTFKFKEGESLTQTFTRYKALMNELVNDGIKLSKLEINTCFINGLPKKWLAFCQSLRNTNHVKESELAYLFGKLKYEENLINSIYDTNKEKTLVPATPLSTAFFFTSIVQDFQDSPNDEEAVKIPSYQSPFQLKLLHSSEHKPEPRHTKDFEAKYNKVKAKLALLSSSASALSSSSGKNKGLIAESYDWNEEEVSSNDNEVTEVKALMALADEERVSKKILGIDQLTEDTSSSGPKDPVFVKSLADNSKVSITGSNKPKLFEAEDSTLSNHDTGESVAPPYSTREADWC